jgi:hypothetical protein
MFSGAALLVNAAVLSTFGQTVTFTVGGVETSCVGVFDVPYTAQGPTDQQFSRPDYSVLVTTDDVDAIGPVAGDTVAIDSSNYIIVDLAPDIGGMTTLTVRPL